MVIKGSTKKGDFCYEHNTGWAKSTDKLNFGEEGLVGHGWKQLDVITDFETKVSIKGIACDHINNPVMLLFSNDGEDWSKFEMLEAQFTNNQMEYTFNQPINVRFARMIWDKTDGSKGFHAQFFK